MKFLHRTCLVTLGWLLACDPLEPSDAGQYGLNIGLHDELGRKSHRVLVGSEFTVSIGELLVEGEVDPAGGGLNCATSTASGSLTKIGGDTFRVETAGPGAVEFAPPIESCPANEDVLIELGPDRWSMTGVEASAATGKWIGSGDQSVMVWDMSPGPAGVFPDALGRPLDEARVAADGWFSLYPVLVDLSLGERAEIRWDDPDAILTVPAHYQELVTDLDGYDQEILHRTSLEGSLRAGDSFESSVTILATEFELPKVEAVPTQHLTQLELVPVYFPGDAQREWGPPAGIVAITRDGEGRRIMGAPIEWSVTRGRVYATEQLAEVIEVYDCRDEPKQPEWRGATIEAKLDHLSAVVDLEWIALPSDDIDPSSEACHGSACNCSTTASPRDGVFAMLALLVLGGVLRRRHSSRASAASTEPR
jgi:MYXO-CTERM domain-containing protein